MFSLLKHGSEVAELIAPYQADWESGSVGAFIFSFCSRTGKARTLTNETAHNDDAVKGFGWIHVGDLVFMEMDTDHVDFVEKNFVLAYERLLSKDRAILTEIVVTSSRRSHTSDRIEPATLALLCLNLSH